MNFAQLRNAVRTRIGVPTSDAFYTDEVLSDLVNEALQVVSSENDWPWLETSTTFALVGGTATYDPPADWVRTRSLCIDGYDAMEWRSLIELREWPSTITDVPRYFNVNAEQITLRPVPASADTVTHDYYKNDQTLVTDSDVPLMPAQFRYAIVAYAVHLAFMRAGDVQRALAASADYAAWLKRMTDNRRRQTGGLRVRVRPGGGFA